MKINEENLAEYLRKIDPLDAIVVEGYDGVGKGRVLELLSKITGSKSYRPDYNLWQEHDLARSDRWKLSAAFWDIFSFMHDYSDHILLFDRGVLSGAVYNADETIARDYHKFIRDMNILHILVVCDSEITYKSLQVVRNPEITPRELDVEYARYKNLTARYFNMLRLADVQYVVYENKFNSQLGEIYSKTCGGCGHYCAGYCQHPERLHEERSIFSPRCEFTLDKEVQDRDVTEVHCV